MNVFKLLFCRKTKEKNSAEIPIVKRKEFRIKQSADGICLERCTVEYGYKHSYLYWRELDFNGNFGDIDTHYYPSIETAKQRLLETNNFATTYTYL